MLSFLNWWHYVIGGILLIVAILAIMLFRGYKKIAAEPLDGIPYPPLTHPMLGHPECLIHPMKHEMCLTMHNAARVPIHQLLLMKQASLFINDPLEAFRILIQFTRKGQVYDSFRYDASIPDILTSDGDAWKLRRDAMGDAFGQLSPDKVALVVHQLIQILSHAADSETILDMRKIFSLFALDVVCLTLFNYDLKALQGAQLGLDLYNSLEVLLAVEQKSGLYSFPNVRNVSKDEISIARKQWQSFLEMLKSSVLDSGERLCSETNDDLQSKKTLSRALYSLYLNPVKQTEYGEAELLSDIHQIVHHAYELIAASLMWSTYALYRNHKVRRSLEQSLMSNETEYLECFIKELLRRYPAAGNFTMREADTAGTLVAGIDIPVKVPVHVHMFTFHNSSQIWSRPKEFYPERWLLQEGIPSTDTIRPICPFSQIKSNEASPDAEKLPLNHPKNYSDYLGTGFEKDSASYFPFSVGAQSCPSSIFVVQLLRLTIREMVVRFRLDVSDEKALKEEDVGGSWSKSICPWSYSSMLVKVRCFQESGTKIIGNDASDNQATTASIRSAGVDADDEGWAQG